MSKNTLRGVTMSTWPIYWGNKDGAVVRALASLRYGPGSIPGPGVTCGLSLLLVLVPALRVFLRVLRFPSLHKSLSLKALCVHFQAYKMLPLKQNVHSCFSKLHYTETPVSLRVSS